MKIKTVLNSGEGVALGNSIRQIALSRTHSWRPIAYSLNIPTTLLHSSNQILEDMIEFSSSLTSLVFSLKQEVKDNYVVEHYMFNETLNGSDLCKGVFEVNNKSKRLLTALSNEGTKGNDSKLLTVVYRLSDGFKDAQSNQEFLDSINFKDKNLKILASRHSDLDYFSFDVVSRDSSEEELILNFSSKLNNEEDIISETIKILSSGLEKIKKATATLS